MIQRPARTIWRKFRALEPASRKFLPAIGHVFSPEYTELEHLFRSQLGRESRAEGAPNRFCAEVNVVLLHFVIHFNPHRFHLMCKISEAAASFELSALFTFRGSVGSLPTLRQSRHDDDPLWLMSNSLQGSQSREKQRRSATRWITNATIALLPVLACFLAGATEKWEEGVVIAILGLCLLVRPPRFSLGTITNLVLLSLCVLVTVALLPADWLFQPEWRASLVKNFGIQLPSTLTPQPWITVTYLVSFVAGLSWLYLVSTQDLGIREVRFQLRLFTGGIVLLAAGCIGFYLMRIKPTFWLNEQNFGPFPNPNQTGD